MIGVSLANTMVNATNTNVFVTETVVFVTDTSGSWQTACYL
jgi:hypothetical protein